MWERKTSLAIGMRCGLEAGTRAPLQRICTPEGTNRFCLYTSADAGGPTALKKLTSRFLLDTYSAGLPSLIDSQFWRFQEWFTWLEWAESRYPLMQLKSPRSRPRLNPD